MRKLYVLLAFLPFIKALAQETDFQLNHPAYLISEMEDVRSATSFSTTVKPFSRRSTVDLIDSIRGSYLGIETRRFSFDSTFSKKPVFKKAYQYPADLLYYEDKYLTLHFNPYIHASYGRSNDDIGSTFINTRGLELRGNIDGKVAFYTNLSENQVRHPQYVNAFRDSTQVVPYEGFWKLYNENGIDFLRAQGYIDVGLSKSISAQFGYGKHFIGNGFRSLILSDFSNNYPYLRLNTQTRLFDYTNVFAELISTVQGNETGLFGTGGFGKKYMALHHLNMKIRPNFHIGLFESVMYGDSTGGLKIEYLNPIIFYRAVEQQNGSEDNAFLGLDFKWNIKNRFSLYGQLAIDEMVVSEVFAGDDWWGNKQGFQLGLKYVDAFSIDNLMLQGEVNKVRPYMYAHEDGFTNYSHYNGALAHPLGANFTEFYGRAIYRMSDKWTFEGSVLLAQYGNDLGTINYGRDILKDYTQRVPNGSGGSLEYGNAHLQGNLTKLAMGFARVTYMARHNLFLDLETTFRSEQDANQQISNTSQWLSASLRWNVYRNSFLF